MNWMIQMKRDEREFELTGAMLEVDKNVEMWKKEVGAMRCPNCKFIVEKTDGCDHMTCRCRYEFCYVCGGKYMKCKCC